ncbi:MAG: prolipoprotein diacylglyceryl transferase [Bdellovibrionota bacterium]
MFPVLVQIGTMKIYSYGFFIALGYISALVLGRYLARSRGLDPAPFMDLAFIAIVSGVIGARVLYIITEPSQFIAHPASVFDVWNGGLVFYGGFLFAVVACFAYGWWKKMPLLLSTDIVVTGVAFAHGFGRIGCFAAGCCHGNYCPYPWGIHNDTEFVNPAFKGQPIHPVQLYESASLFALSLLLTWMVAKRKVKSGIGALTYLMGYAVIRFVMEFYRGDDDRGVVLGGALSTSQGIALALFLFGCGGILVGRFRSKNL